MKQEQTSETAAANQADHAEFKQLLQEHYAAWSAPNGKANLDRVAEFYAQDAELIFFDPTPPLEGNRGWANWREFLQKTLFDQASSVMMTTNDDLRVWRRKDLVWTAFTFHFSVKFKNGKALELDGRQTNIWERRNGSWLIVHEHASSPLAVGVQPAPRSAEQRVASRQPTPDGEFKRLVDDFWAAWSTRNPSEPSRFYAKDDDLVFYVVFPPFAGYVGWNQFSGDAPKFFFDKLKSVKFTAYDDLQVTRRSDIAWTIGTFRIAMQTKDGKQVDADARMTLVWEKRDGRWLLVHEHLSVPVTG